MNDVEYSNEFGIIFKDGSSQFVKLHSFSQLLFSCNKDFKEVVSITRVPKADYVI